MQKLTDQTINKNVEYTYRYLESHNVDKTEAIRWKYYLEAVLMLYKEDGAEEMSVRSSCVKNCANIEVRVKGKKKDYAQDDPVVTTISGKFIEKPRYEYKRNSNIIRFSPIMELTEKDKLKFLGGYLKRVKTDCFAALFSQALMIATSITIPLYTAKIVQALEVGEAERIIIVAVVLALLGILNYFLEFLCGLFFTKIYNFLLNEMDMDLSRRVLCLDEKTMKEYGSGVFIQRMVYDTDTLAQGFNKALSSISVFVNVLGVLIAMSVVSPVMALYSALVACYMSAIEVIRLRKKKEDSLIYETSKEQYTGFIGEMVRGSSEIRLNNSKEEFLNQLSDTIRETNENNMRMEKRSISMIFTRKGGKECLDFVFFAMMAWLLYLKKITPTSALVIFNYYLVLATFGPAMEQLTELLNSVSVSSERIIQLLFSGKFTEEHFGMLYPDKFEGSVTFENVEFTYPDREYGKAERSVINGLSAHIKAGEHIAIVGKSGCGKTTTLKLLTGLYKVTSGRILIDGVDINELSESFMRDNISMVSQQPYIFNMSIRDNLNLADANVSDEDIKKACISAGIYDDIMKMPNGFDTILGEGGVFLSGGQKQRIAIARCLIRNSKMLLLDESTSALDNITQNHVIEEIGKQYADMTVITVAHRLSTAIQSDKILLMEDGKMVDMGTHEELMSRCGKYQELYSCEKE